MPSQYARYRRAQPIPIYIPCRGGAGVAESRVEDSFPSKLSSMPLAAVVIQEIRLGR
jgi:hypothetical protein